MMISVRVYYRLDDVHPRPEYRYRWKNETCAGPAKLTGYKSLPLSVLLCSTT